jgi:Mrp family chromosome partitioning ATPase
VSLIFVLLVPDVMFQRIAHSPAEQRLKGTDWGDLDVLILDMPPGTGDVQLTVCQDLDLSGAVGVTTPSKLAIADARKGIEMFSELGVPTFAMVENMSYFEVRRLFRRESSMSRQQSSLISCPHNL